MSGGFFLKSPSSYLTNETKSLENPRPLPGEQLLVGEQMAWDVADLQKTAAAVDLVAAVVSLAEHLGLRWEWRLQRQFAE